MQSTQITQVNNQVGGPDYITQEMKETWMRPYVPNRQDFETIQDYVNTMVNTYFVKFCQLEGYEALEKAVGNWLLECEEEFGGPGSIGYGERGQFLPREEGAVLIAKEIKDKAEIISILDIPSPTDNTPVMVPAILPPSDKIPEPQATYSDAQDEYLTPSLFEDWEWAIRTTGIELARKQMARTFYKYQEIVQHQKQMTLMKQQLTLRFAEDVNYWSHLKFTQPRPTPGSVEAYLSSKHANLKAEIPNDFLYPSLLRAARNGDTWAIIDQEYEEFEDELMSTGGICDENRNFSNQTVPLDEESSDLN